MKLLLIDGNSLINRSFYAIRLLTNKKGVPTNAITGFFSTLLRLKKNLVSDCIIVAFDLRAPTFRHEMYDGYKKRRKGMPEELAAQIPYIKEILDAMGIARVESEGFEADDIIGTISHFAGEINADTIIATGDRDSFQLITNNVSVCLASTKEEIIYTPEKIENTYGIKPLQFIEVKALMGDSSDDIPGVAGIGEKTAYSLIQKFGSVDYIYDNLDNLDISTAVKSKLGKGKDSCLLSRELGRIATNAPIDLSIVNYKINSGDEQKLTKILTELEINSLLKKLELTPGESKLPLEESPIEQNSDSVITLEKSLEPVLQDMKEAGIKVDIIGIQRFGEELELQITELQSQIHQIAGEEFLISSPKQLGEILFDKLSLPHAKKTKTGYSTNSDVLDMLFDKHPIIPFIIEYRELTKLNSTYVQGLLNHVGQDRKIHTTFKNETRTGRLSSVEPNIQNIPVRTERGRILRRFFIAEQGNLLIDADYSQIELRVLAHISEDPLMLKAFRNNADIHAITAAQVFNIPESSVSREMRSAAKAVNFGIVYGMGAFSLSKEIGVSVAEAGDYIKRYLERYQGVREYLERTVEEAKSCGYVKTLLGRVRHIPEIKSSNHNIRSNGERIAKNTPIQGTAADIIKIAMVKVYNRLKNETLPSPKPRLILQVHDELIAEAPENFAEQATGILEEEMVAAGKELNIDLTVDIRKGKSWYETH